MEYTENDVNQSSTAHSAKKRKPRAKLSCVRCRQKKLKCNRQQPCDNCIKHHRAYDCLYSGPHTLTRNQSHGLRDQLRAIQSRVEALYAINASQVHPSGSALINGNVAASLDTKPVQPERAATLTGNITVDQNGTQYADSTHWQSILNEIAEVKEYLQATEDAATSTDEPLDDSLIFPNSGPQLLLGHAFPDTKSDLIAALPPRQFADRLVSLYLNSRESTLILMHIPTFTREYAQFWHSPEEKSFGWLAYLFCILSAGAGLQLFSTTGRSNGDLAETFAEYHKISSQCLQMSGYTSPGRYTIETLTLNVAMEILRSPENHRSPSVLISLATRLAIQAGYHRDPKYYANISVFDGEMRRRVWTYLSLLDYYVSIQAGLPPTIIRDQCDIEEPRNLTDDDLIPTATVLPPSRPLSEKTAVLFPIILKRVLVADAEIIGKNCSGKGLPYDEVLRMDGHLQVISASIPPQLRIRSLGEAIADSPSTITERYNIDLIYQKSLCDLHRRYLVQHRLDPAYEYSRKVCIAAAKAVLQHQSDIFEAGSAGGQLSFASFFFTPIVAVHFRSAAMLLCLEISCQSRFDLKQHLSPEQRQAILDQRKDLSNEIERAHSIWDQLRHQSKEASKTADALQIMLTVTNHHLQHGATPQQTQQPSWSQTNINRTDTTQSHTNSAPFLPMSAGYQPLPTGPSSEQSPLDVDLMDATFYFGQDITPSTMETSLMGSHGLVDFYEKYWDNLMILGDEQSTVDHAVGENAI
ncbi:Fungal Zn(2)-Cys(6) binuclear cluster domain-containing protein [Penicillium ucsense]|nr:Fungal Zn(2)-Cys(6) binuclear cluster domain-containing protein [Penicillium ucsense]